MGPLHFASGVFPAAFLDFFLYGQYQTELNLSSQNVDMFDMYGETYDLTKIVLEAIDVEHLTFFHLE